MNTNSGENTGYMGMGEEDAAAQASVGKGFQRQMNPLPGGFGEVDAALSKSDPHKEPGLETQLEDARDNEQQEDSPQKQTLVLPKTGRGMYELITSWLQSPDIADSEKAHLYKLERVTFKMMDLVLR